MPGFVKAGKILRVVGWVHAVAAGCGALFVLSILAMPDLQAGRRDQVMTVGTVGTVAMALGAFLHLWVGNAVIARKKWSRVVGIILGALMLSAFPIGTVAGGFLIYYLASGWDAPAPAAEA